MKRRTFLLSASASALALALPLPALAATRHDIGKIKLIERAFDFGKLLGFDLYERHLHFGYLPWTAVGEKNLRDRVQKSVLGGDINTWNRVRMLAAMFDQVEAHYPGDREKQAQMLGQLHLHNRTIRTAMCRGDLTDLYLAARLLGSSVEFHSVAEMWTFV